MNNDRTAAFVLGALALIALGAHALHALPPLSGESLGVLAGTMRDSHLLSAGIWDRILQSCGTSQACMQLPNVVGLALLAAVCALLAFRARGVLAGALAGALVATTPLALGFTLDPLGGELAFALVLFSVAAADLCGIVTFGSPVRALLALALALQDPALAPASLVYAVLARPRGRMPLLALAGAGAGTAIALAVLKGAPFASGLDPLAAPLSFIVFAAIFFGVLPALAFASKLAAVRNARLDVAMAGNVSLFALVAAAGAMFAPAGDPAPYFVAATIALGFAILVSVPRQVFATANPLVAASAFALIALQIAGWKFAAAEPAAQIARHTEALRAALQRKSPLCIVLPPGVRPHALAHGAFFKVYGGHGAAVHSRETVDACIGDTRPPAHLIAFSDFGMVDYGEPGFALAVAAAHAVGARDVALLHAFVTPARAVALPGGHGAFATLTATALQPVSEIVVTAGYSYVANCTGVKGRALTFAVSNPVAGGAPLRYAVTERSPAGARLLSEREIPRSASGGEWQYVSVELQSPCRTLEFSARTTTGEGTGAWAAFAAPSIRETP